MERVGDGGDTWSREGKRPLEEGQSCQREHWGPWHSEPGNKAPGTASTCLHKSVLVRSGAPSGVQVPRRGYKSRDAGSVFSSKKERTIQVCTRKSTKPAKDRLFGQASTRCIPPGGAKPSSCRRLQSIPQGFRRPARRDGRAR